MHSPFCPWLRTNRSALEKPANSAGTAVFAVKADSLTTSEAQKTFITGSFLAHAEARAR
jgi:hypothetical protein